MNKTEYIQEQIIERYNLEETLKDKEFWLIEVNKVLKELWIDLEDLKNNKKVGDC